MRTRAHVYRDRERLDYLYLLSFSSRRCDREMPRKLSLAAFSSSFWLYSPQARPEKTRSAFSHKQLMTRTKREMRRKPGGLLCAVSLAQQHEGSNYEPCYGIQCFKSRNSCSRALGARSRCGTLILTAWLRRSWCRSNGAGRNDGPVARNWLYRWVLFAVG